MKISIFGIGYVGAVSAACLVKDGNQVVCVDPNPDKVNSILQKSSPILEPGLDELIVSGVDSGNLTAIGDAAEAVRRTDLSILCVGTPSRLNGSLDTGYVARAAEEVGAAIKRKVGYHSVVVRSTILPGTMEELVVPALERASGMRAGADFGVAYYPEFLRESTAIADYYSPGAIVFGQFDGDHVTIEKLHALVSHIPVKPFVVPLREAEAVKYANNAWHALKISFANELGNICKGAGADSFRVLEILCSDTRLNISKAYLKPGFAFGGSCLPKDLRALRYRARQLDVPTPVMDAALTANENQLARAYQMIMAAQARRIGMIGLSFKPNTDDLRESPLVELAERLHGKGLDLRIYDPNVDYAFLTGTNLHYVRSHLPHLSSLMVDSIDKLISHGEVIVVGKQDEAAKRLVEGAAGNRLVIDLVRLDAKKRSNDIYQGICW